MNGSEKVGRRMQFNPKVKELLLASFGPYGKCHCLALAGQTPILSSSISSLSLSSSSPFDLLLQPHLEALHDGKLTYSLLLDQFLSLLAQTSVAIPQLQSLVYPFIHFHLLPLLQQQATIHPVAHFLPLTKQLAQTLLPSTFHSSVQDFLIALLLDWLQYASSCAASKRELVEHLSFGRKYFTQLVFPRENTPLDRSALSLNNVILSIQSLSSVEQKHLAERLTETSLTFGIFTGDLLFKEQQKTTIVLETSSTADLICNASKQWKRLEDFLLHLQLVGRVKLLLTSSAISVAVAELGTKHGIVLVANLQPQDLEYLLSRVQIKPILTIESLLEPNQTGQCDGFRLVTYSQTLHLLLKKVPLHDQCPLPQIILRGPNKVLVNQYFKALKKALNVLIEWCAFDLDSDVLYTLPGGGAGFFYLNHHLQEQAKEQTNPLMSILFELFAQVALIVPSTLQKNSATKRKFLQDVLRVHAFYQQNPSNAGLIGYQVPKWNYVLSDELQMTMDGSEMILTFENDETRVLHPYSRFDAIFRHLCLSLQQLLRIDWDNLIFIRRRKLDH